MHVRQRLKNMDFIDENLSNFVYDGFASLWLFDVPVRMHQSGAVSVLYPEYARLPFHLS